MKIIPVSGLNFLARIIDSHAHVGSVNGVEYKKEQLDIFVKSNLSNNDKIEKVLVSNLDVLCSKKTEYEGNKDLIDIFRGSKEYGLFATCSPKDGSVNNIKRLLEEHPKAFIGLKFHPDMQSLSLVDRRYLPYLDFANRNKIPCLFHSAIKVDNYRGFCVEGEINFSHPRFLYNLAKDFKDTPIVMAHLGAGWNQSHEETIKVLLESIKKGDANLYADISWVNIDSWDKEYVVKVIKKLKGIGEENWTYGDQSYRIMFGSDAPLDRFSQPNAKEVYSNYVESIKQAIRNDNDLKHDAEKIIDDLFFNNAQKLYLDNPIEITKPRKSVYNGFSKFKNFAKNYKIGIVSTSFLAIVTGAVFLSRKKKRD